MLLKVGVRNGYGEELEMELAHPERSGFAIFDIEGIGPVKALVTSTPSIGFDGETLDNIRLPGRVITMRIRFFKTATEDVEDLRRKSYKYFPIKGQVQLTFTTDKRVTSVFGTVEGNEPVIFSKEEHTEITIFCEDPYFTLSGSEIPTSIASNIPAYDQWFSLPEPTNSPAAPFVVFGEYVLSNNNVIINNYGDMSIGIVISCRLINAVTKDDLTFSMVNLTTGEQMSFEGFALAAGSPINISTIPGKKYMYSSRPYWEFLSGLSYPNVWLLARPGINQFAINSNLTSVVISWQPLTQGV